LFTSELCLFSYRLEGEIVLSTERFVSIDRH